MKYLLWGIPALILAGIIGIGLGTWYANSQADEPAAIETKIPPAPEVEPGSAEETAQIIDGESLFKVHDEIVVDWASNPMVIETDGESLTLAYESRSTQLKFAPQDKVKLIYSEDGVTFEEIENESAEPPKPPGVQIREDLWRRYTFQPGSGGVMSSSSVDGETYVDDGVIVFEAHAEDASDAREFGVYTYFMDDQGGVVMLFNKTDEAGDIVVDRAYAEPESEGLTFTLMEEDILAGTLEHAIYADPNAIVLNDGTIFLIIMNQSDAPKPPLGKQGIIHGYTSDNYGETFEYYGQLLSYEDVHLMETFSLNDPKIVAFNDGTLRLYVAAMNEEETSETGYKWTIVTAESQ